MGEELNLTRRSILAGAAATGAFVQAVSTPGQAQSVMTKATATDVAKLPRVKPKLVDPPFVHAHEQIATGGPKLVEFEMTIHEKKIVIDDAGTETFAFTFNGTVPGPLMVVHEGDYVELTLINAETNELMHNIDFHSATGALGGGALTEVGPGERTVLRWKATRPGVFVYHCAPPGMVPWHVTAGMNGAIMVLPRDGLKDHQGKSLKYDKVYYVGEQDFYVPRDETGKFKRYASVGESHDDVVKAMRTLTPSHVVFNGKVGGLTGKNALTAKVGETVLIVHSQANRDTRPHLIGGHGDYVWATGKFRNPPERDLETWFIPGGCAGAALYTFLQPGIYAYVNHNLIEAFELGAAGHFKVEGEWNDDLMKQIRAPAGI
ncbi:Copper-containing nitrite reductase [Bosea sp. 62]|jgi:nitrite reductase (NO-forming)|uniref:Copper-containing nitrite reductase n=2 Tax=Hyphomicrobiales TaxID=356 RepID=A0ABW0HD69_9HYPH|nr:MULTISPECIES: copper-containing nitrite reductase [unclassified Bosea (in: a-proteobacteria)]CAD5294477.1 Copper-containing nitrite reductase [Bosea sp. 21B]CAD5295019.1 Copper-containing nitrite reductase [Bosea sp. 46]CAD5298704.1 Copper-containing nitrite reductase [Bosea sp. 7B]VVT60883.1 Copper-containing nitrite reductase [Bosea sp. EC-HK365B]VXB37965.1 Copper-containing nitrite reductase [Bosea sp. 127]